MLKYEEAPRIIIIHIGDTDIGYLNTKTLCERIKGVFYWGPWFTAKYHVGMVSNTPYIKLEIFKTFKFNGNEQEQNAHFYCIICKQVFIRYSEIKMDQKFEDGVHLSILGCQIFINTLQSGD